MGANVVAYGDKIWEVSTEGEGMYEFIIPLNIEYGKNSKPDYAGCCR